MAVERARQTYAHVADCTYVGAEPPLSLCGCGKAKDLPLPFVERMKKSVNAVGARLPPHSLFYRAALSPLYLPLEKHPMMLKGKKAPKAPHTSACAKCGKAGNSLRCARCRRVVYCSKKCQREDWKTHKPGCG